MKVIEVQWVQSERLKAGGILPTLSFSPMDGIGIDTEG